VPQPLTGWGAWAVALRPRSLPVALSPVIVGAALGWARTGQIDALAALGVLLAALLMQLITNLQNDVGYTVRGGERSGTRTGLPRATAEGWLTVRQVRRAIVGASGLALLVGLALTGYRGWPVLAIGAASLLAALAYMGGPRPIAYTPLGELTVLLFFGVVAVNGTDWVLTGSVGPASLWASLAVGSLAAAALAANNHRDRVHDAQVGRRTFAVCCGERASQGLYSVLLLTPFVGVLASALLTQTPAWLLPLLLGPTALGLRRDFMHCAPGLPYNAIVQRSFGLGLAYAALLALAALV
jgi:1,4-dihydroxy-2-naphthoate octaprenyltransferase